MLNYRLLQQLAPLNFRDESKTEALLICVNHSPEQNTALLRLDENPAGASLREYHSGKEISIQNGAFEITLEAAQSCAFTLIGGE